MEKTSSLGLKARTKFLRVICAIAILSLIAPSGITLAGGVAMAPPVDTAYAAEPTGDSVFNWNEVPEDQEVPIQKAVFDHGGYQLYDSVGETIVVPFAHNDLYVMKFAVSPNDTMYFENTGSAPVLYCPRDGYLENASVGGARWYPFSEHFHPVTPVYEGIAPSWPVYVDMGWYPDMACYGGYWCDRPFFAGGLFVATIGLLFVIGGHDCDGWHSFDVFCDHHPWFHHEGFFHPAVYSIGARSFAWRNHFGGTVHDLRSRGFTARARGFNSSGRPFQGAAAFRAQRNGWNGGARNAQAFHGNNRGVQNARAFHGNAGARNAQAFHGNNRGVQSARAFHGNNRGVQSARAFHGNNRGTQGNRSFGARSASNGGRTFQGGRRSFAAHHATPSGRSFNGGNRSFGGARSFGGGNRSFGGGSRSFGGGNRSFGGNARSFGGGGRSFGGNARPSGGGGGGGRGGGGGGRSGGGHGGGNHHQH